MLKEIPFQGDCYDASTIDMVYVLTEMQRTVFFDLVIPAALNRKKLESTLKYELESRIPIPMDEIKWGYHRSKHDGTEFRLYAIHADEYEKTLRILREGMIKGDMMIPAGLVRADLKSLPTEDAREQLLKHLREDPYCKRIVPVTSMIPKELKPVRYLNWKRLYALLLVLLFVCAGTAGWMKYMDYRRTHNELLQCKSALSEDLRKQKRLNVEYLKEKELFQKLSSAKIGDSRILAVLADLSERLPQHMWIANYTQAGEIIDISITSQKDEPALYKSLGESASYQVINLRKNRNPDGSIVFNVRLRNSKE